jgi:hypothetical protein
MAKSTIIPLSKSCSPDDIPVFMSTLAQRFGPFMKKLLKIWPDISPGRVYLQQRMIYIPREDASDGIAKFIYTPKKARARRHSAPCGVAGPTRGAYTRKI